MYEIIKTFLRIGRSRLPPGSGNELSVLHKLDKCLVTEALA